MSISAQNRSLPDWFARLRTRQTVLPRFQRFEAWGHAQVTQLFNTILQGLPVGAALVLNVGNEELFLSRTLEGAPEKGERVTEHLLDGQQRLTALWRGLHNNYDDRTYFLCMEQDEESGLPYYVESIARWRRDGNAMRMPLWADVPKEQWKRKRIPLDLCAPTEDSQQAYRAWARAAVDEAEEREEMLDQISTIRSKFATFNLPYLALPVTTTKETAVDVFVKLNTSATPLSTYDIVVAQVEAAMGRSLHDLVADIRDACPLISQYYPPESAALYASALLQGRPPTNGSYLAKDFGRRLVEGWDVLREGMRRAVTFLEEERVYDNARLPTDIVVPVLVALWGCAPDGLDQEGWARSVLRRYLWRAFFTDRYERGTSSRSLADFNELRSVIADAEGATPAIFDDALHPMPEPAQLRTAGWPKYRDRLGRAILALALRQGGLDLADGSTVSRANLAKREYHHLFPDAHLRGLGVASGHISLSLNCALVTWRTNRNISAKDPERYLGERSEANRLGEPEVRARLASHLIPFDALSSGDYEHFLDMRAQLVHASMRKLCHDGRD